MHPMKIAHTAVFEHGAIQKVSELGRFTAMVMDLDPLNLIVEVGSFDGGTLWAWQQICPEVVGVDLPPPGLEDDVRLNSLGCPIICGDSHDEATRDRLINTIQGRAVDMLFIDGDHSYHGVKADYELYSPLVRPGGLIGFHDICTHPDQPYIQVNRFWATLDLDTEAIIEESTTPSWGGIGVIRVPVNTEADERARKQRDVSYQMAQQAAYGQPRQKATTA